MNKTVIILIFICRVLYGQRADFFKEDITFRLDSVHFSTEGYYWFSNTSDKPVHSNIYYPFPNFSNEKIDSVHIFNISAGADVKYIKEEDHGISFNLFLGPNDTVLFQIGYRQKLQSDSAVYILRTTKGWGKPLNTAEYNLIISKNFVIKKFSYPPLKSYNIKNKKIYIWRMKNFMPIYDMIFHF